VRKFHEAFFGTPFFGLKQKEVWGICLWKIQVLEPFIASSHLANLFMTMTMLGAKSLREL